MAKGVKLKLVDEDEDVENVVDDEFDDEFVDDVDVDVVAVCLKRVKERRVV